MSNPQQVQTAYTQKNYLVQPLATVQTNEVDYPQQSFHMWSNQRSYGNVVVGTSDDKGNILGKVSPWNRLSSAQHPYDTFVKIENAWSTNPNMCHTTVPEKK
jgi:hypothetical protein